MVVEKMTDREKRRQAEADEIFVRRVFELHGRAMLAYATRLTGGRGAAEDLVQEALVRAWRHAEDLAGREGSARGWLLTVVRNLVRDRARARKVRPGETSWSADLDLRQADHTDHADQAVTSTVVREVLDRVSDNHRLVLEHVYLRGETIAQAAAALGLPCGTVKSRCHHALRSARALAGWTNLPLSAI
jgi:RNA polymerase sigma-70 factor (ECF subfamily)